MKELLIIAISSALVSNVVLSQFLQGIWQIFLRQRLSKKVETAAGMGGAVIFVITIASIRCKPDLSVRSGTAWYRLHENHRFHSRYRSTGSDR